MIRRTLVLLTAWLALAASAQPKRPYAGRAIVDVIVELQQSGLSIIYSTDLVKPSMRVVEEPKATSGRALLDEILAPHALSTKEVSAGVLSIIRLPHPQALPVQEPPRVLQPVIPMALGSIVVTASDYSVLGSGPERRDFLTRQELNRTAHLGDDVFRALGQLPGAASTDFSAAFGVRGGLPRETLVVIDGLEIAEPFHIKYFQNAISIIDSDAIGSLDYLSGGFPVEYGGGMSGVIDMSTAIPNRQHRTYAGVSFTHARLVTDGTFDDDRGQWLVSVRRGYFDLLLSVFYPSVTARPRYGDIIAKVEERVGDRSLLSVNVLGAVDHFRYDRNEDSIEAAYDNVYGWLNLRTSWTPRTSSQIVASLSRLRQRRGGSLDSRAQFGSVRDRRVFDIAGIKQDWTYDRSDRGHFVKFGADIKRFGTNYDYASESIIRESFLDFAGNPRERSRALSIRPSGHALALYAADRIRVARPLAIEVGARFERESWHSANAAVTPRVNVVLALGDSTALRASWGEFRQAQRLDEIAVEDGEVATHPAERSRQAEIGLEHHFRFGLLARATVYHKAITNVRPRYENLLDRDQFFPEVTYDRVRVAADSARADGVELLMKDDSSRPFTWWLSVAQSKAVDRFGIEEVPRSWDQPRALSFNMNYRLGSDWNFNLGGLFHTGWPTTRVTALYDNSQTPFPVALIPGPRNRDRLPAYRRFDTRVMRSATFSRGVFRSWIEVTNVLNHVNPCCVGGFNINIDPSHRTVDLARNMNGLGWLPSFGIAWEF